MFLSQKSSNRPVHDFLQNNYLTFRDIAKHYVKVEEWKTWFDAKEHCNSLNGRLMEVRTQEEFERAMRFRRENGNNIWLGGSDREVEGEWRWESNDG